MPKLQGNPVTGYGLGQGNGMVGFFSPSGVPTVDSYLITLLMDGGVPLLVLFFGVIIVTAFQMARLYLETTGHEGVFGASIAGALLSFGLYRLVLTQEENHFLMFLLVALSVFLVSENRRRSAARTPERPAIGRFPNLPAPAARKSSA